MGMQRNPKGSSSVEEGLNLGAKSRAMLAEIGIHTLDDLRRAGSVNTYLELKLRGQPASLVMLYALEGAITNTHWLVVKRERKRELLAAIQ
jgi:DNA transformation protein